MTDWHYVVMPIAGAEAYTYQAIADVLAQTVPTKLLLINQALPTSFRTHLESLVEQQPDRLLLWSHVPSLPSLSSTWNRALQFCWECGAREAWVVNNDACFSPSTFEMLSLVLRKEDALFVSAVGVREGQFEPRKRWHLTDIYGDGTLSKGGPDFSCFLISKECHEKYKFDESHIPAYAEDLTMHREIMLGGDGRRIFSVNIPYLHYASGTLKSLDPVAKEALERRIGNSRSYYARVWGGPPNHEVYAVKGDPSSSRAGVTTPELQVLILAGGTVHVPSDDASCSATLDSPQPC